VEERDGDVRFTSGSGNMAVLCMRTASGHYYRNSSVVVDLAMGQIPRSTERLVFTITFIVGCVCGRLLNHRIGL